MVSYSSLPSPAISSLISYLLSLISILLNTILYLQPQVVFAARQRAAGLVRFAHARGDWSVQIYEGFFNDAKLAELMEFWNPAGVVVGSRGGGLDYDVSSFDPMKTVLLECFPDAGGERFASVVCDRAFTPAIALKELIMSECAALAVVPWSMRREWSELRRAEFLRIARDLGRPVFEHSAIHEPIEIQDIQRDLAEWLVTLPKPCGVFAVNDVMAMHVAAAAKLAGIEVPFDIRIVGVDDDTYACEAASPALSSIGLDFEGAGHLAGETLAKLLAGEIRPEETHLALKPTGLVRRDSTRLFKRTDRQVLAAIELIRAEACSGLTAKEALATFNCSRRLAEMRFREATGKSVLEEIRDVRIEKAKRLLRDPLRELSVIAGMCGYESDTSFRRIFREATGVTMSEWRKSCRTCGR